MSPVEVMFNNKDDSEQRLTWKAIAFREPFAEIDTSQQDNSLHFLRTFERIGVFAVCVLTSFILCTILCDHSAEQRHELHQDLGTLDAVNPKLAERERDIPIMRLRDEIRRASGESVEHDKPQNSEAKCDHSVKAAPGLFEPLFRLFRIFNPVTLPSRLLSKVHDLVGFFKNPTWGYLAVKIGCQNVKNPAHSLQRRPKRLAPSFQDCKDNGISTTQRLMGLSCLVWFLPGMFYLQRLCVASSTMSPQETIIGGVASIFLAYVSSVSFMADYWYTGDDENRINPVVPEHQKQYIFNTIDLVNVPLIGTFCTSLSVLHYFYGNGYNWTSPALFLVFSGAVVIQQVSLRYQEKYTDVVYEDDGCTKEGYDRSNAGTEETHNITMCLNLHIVWHILAGFVPFVQMYLLTTVGMTTPSWMSCCC